MEFWLLTSIDKIKEGISYLSLPFIATTSGIKPLFSFLIILNWKLNFMLGTVFCWDDKVRVSRRRGHVAPSAGAAQERIQRLQSRF